MKVLHLRAFCVGGLVVTSGFALAVEVLAQTISIPGQTSFASRFVSAPVDGYFYVSGNASPNGLPYSVTFDKRSSGSIRLPWLTSRTAGWLAPIRPVPQYLQMYMLQFDEGAGTASLNPYDKYRQQLPVTTLSDPAGPVVGFENSIAVNQDGVANILFEVQPGGGGTNKVIVLNYKPGILNHKRTYMLAPGESVLDCAPRLDGGLIFLSGTSTSTASVNYIDPAGVKHGPYFVGPASQIEYSPVDGGMILTAGVTGAGDMFFAKGPLDGPPTETIIETLTIPNNGLQFQCSSVMSDGTCWWGGAYTSLLGDKNGLVVATTGGSKFQAFGSQSVASQVFDETVTSIATTPRGYGIWACDGAIGVFDTSDGSTFATYPAVPDVNLKFTSVAVSPIAETGFSESFTFFGATAYNAVTMQSTFVRAYMAGELYRADSSRPSVVGGTSCSVYAQMFATANKPFTFPVTSDSANVTVPTTVSFANWFRVAKFTVDTQPVSVAEDVNVTIGATRSVIARLTILPPTPYLFTPADQTIPGGATTVSRLSLNGKAPVGGLAVALTSDGSEVMVDPTVVVPAGLYSRSFVIRSSPVASLVTRTITATYAGVAKTSSITLTP